MQLVHIPLKDLKISKTNMRHKDGPPDISDILPSVRAKGVLMPLLVRPEDGKFGVVAGRRRYFCLKTIKQDAGEVADPPCAVMEEGDDGDAIEASLLENVARRDADPMREYETFAKLIIEGRTPEGIGHTFGLTKTQVKQRLALGNLLPKIRDAYRSEEIDDETVQHLTMASPAQQRKWLRLFSDPKAHAPKGWQLKQWLFGGQEIPVGHALFRIEDYTGHIIEDLFGENRYFADADLFWALQNRAIAAKRDALIKKGWEHIGVLEVGQRFDQYEHVKTPKTKGGKVFIATSHDGEVTVYDGYLSRKEAKKLQSAKAKSAKGEAQPQSGPRPAITKAMQNYLDLHRHAVVRLALLSHPGAAFRLAVAHMIAPTGNWSVKPDAQRANSKDIGDSVAHSAAQKTFEIEGVAVSDLLGLGEVADTTEIFARLLDLTDAEVMRVAAYHMAESMDVGGDVVEDIGLHFQVDPRTCWQPDNTFFDLIRERASVNALLEDVAGEAVAKSNIAEKTKTQKQVIRDCLTGSNGRSKVEGWLPGWMAFPQTGPGIAAVPAQADEVEDEEEGEDETVAIAAE